MVCAQCGEEVNDDAKFCKHCGSAAPAAFPGYDEEEEEEDARFIDSAPPLTEQAPAAQRPVVRDEYPSAKKKRNSTAVIVVLCALLAVAAAAIALMYINSHDAAVAGGAESMSTAQRHETEASEISSTTPGTLVLASGDPVKAAYAIASSERKPMPDTQAGKIATYGAANALESNNGTAWVEGVDGDGIGEWIQIHLSQQASLAGLRVKNGYWKSEGHLLKNTRVARILVSFSDGKSEEFVLNDPLEQLPNVLSTSGQKIAFASPHVSDYVKVTILAVYRDGAVDHDTCITEIVPLANLTQ